MACGGVRYILKSVAPGDNDRPVASHDDRTSGQKLSLLRNKRTTAARSANDRIKANGDGQGLKSGSPATSIGPGRIRGVQGCFGMSLVPPRSKTRPRGYPRSSGAGSEGGRLFRWRIRGVRTQKKRNAILDKVGTDDGHQARSCKIGWR